MLSRRSLLRSAALSAGVSLGAPMINRGRFSLFAQDRFAQSQLGKDNDTYSTRAVDLVHQTTVIDMLGLLTLNYRKLSDWEENPARFQPADFLRLRSSGITIFHPAVGYTSGDIYAESLRDITGWNRFLAAHPSQFLRVDCAADFARAKSQDKIGILIGQQNSEHFRGVDDVNRFYDLGQRVSQLTYTGNRIGGGSSDARDIGLTPYGAHIVERMNAVGMAVDVSHCGDRTTLDAIEASSKPVLVTHSNCRALVPGVARCKTDEAIARMAAKGGVMGITMVRAFVGSTPRITIDNVLDHMQRVASLVGVEHVGVGSDVDLDGRDLAGGRSRSYDLDGINYTKKIYDVTEGLVRRNFSSRDIELILGGNFQRALGEAWKA